MQLFSNSIISNMLPDSPFLPRSRVARERNPLDGFPSLKYRTSHTVAPNPDTFHQVVPSNGAPDRNSGSSSGYVPFQPAPSHLYESVAQSGHSDATQFDTSNPVYCNLPFQQNSAPFVPLTRHNLAACASFDSLDSSRQDTFSSPHHSPIHTDTFQPVKFISTDESDIPHNSMRSLATPSTRLFLSTPLDTSMLSLSASQDCIYDSNRNTQKKCIKLLSASMNLNPEVTSWVIPPSARAKRRSLAPTVRGSLAGSVEAMEFESVDRVAQSVPLEAPRRDKGISKMLSGLFGFLKFPSRKRFNQSTVRSGKRKNRGRVIEHPTISHTSGNVSQPLPFMSLPAPPTGHIVHSDTYRSHSPVLSVPIVPDSSTPHSRESRTTHYGAVMTQLERKISSQSNQTNSSPGSQVAESRHNRPTQLPLSDESADKLYENIPLKSPPRHKPPIPRPNSIYSNIQESLDTSPPKPSLTPDPGGPRHISDTRNRAGTSGNLIGYSETVPYAGLRRAVAEHSSAKRERNVKNVGSTPSMNIPTFNGKATDHESSGFGSRMAEEPNPLTGPTSRRATSTRPSLTPKPAIFSSVETLC